jgi:hypothetical protein
MRAFATSATRRAAVPGNRNCASSRSSRSWEITTLGTERRAAHAPRPRSVSRSDTSIASGRSRSSSRCTRHGSTAR